MVIIDKISQKKQTQSPIVQGSTAVFCAKKTLQLISITYIALDKRQSLASVKVNKFEFSENRKKS